MKKMIVCSMLLLTFLMTSESQEWRAFWADAWNKGISTPTAVKEMVSIAHQYGYNAIVVQVRRRGDAIYFPTAPNAEPRMAGLAANFDALQAILDEAKLYGIEVHAWITTFVISRDVLPESPDHVYYKHPEYLTQNQVGEKNLAEGYYLDPGNPDALAWNERVVMDIITHYAVDGFHFDYIRYPQQDSGYNPTAIARYNAQFQLTGKPLPNDLQFSAWRRRQITDWLRNMYVKMIAVKPQLKVTAATFATRSDAYENRFQDWAGWMQEGILDANLPMNYSTNLSVFKTRTDEALRHSYGRHVYMGVGAYLLAVEDTITQLQYARDSKAQGLILFSYANNSKGDWLGNFKAMHQKLFFTASSVPSMPWKNKPICGYIQGKITAQNGNALLYNANLRLSSCEKQTQSSSLGNFSFLNLMPGKYQVTCTLEGFVPEEKEITIAAGEVANLDFALQAK